MMNFGMREHNCTRCRLLAYSVLVDFSTGYINTWHNVKLQLQHELSVRHIKAHLVLDSWWLCYSHVYVEIAVIAATNIVVVIVVAIVIVIVLYCGCLNCLAMVTLVFSFVVKYIYTLVVVIVVAVFYFYFPLRFLYTVITLSALKHEIIKMFRTLIIFVERNKIHLMGWLRWFYG